MLGWPWPHERVSEIKKNQIYTVEGDLHYQSVTHSKNTSKKNYQIFIMYNEPMEKFLDQMKYYRDKIVNC